MLRVSVITCIKHSRTNSSCFNPYGFLVMVNTMYIIFLLLLLNLLNFSKLIPYILLIKFPLKSCTTVVHCFQEQILISSLDTVLVNV